MGFSRGVVFLVFLEILESLVSLVSLVFLETLESLVSQSARASIGGQEKDPSLRAGLMAFMAVCLKNINRP